MCFSRRDVDRSVPKKKHTTELDRPNTQSIFNPSACVRRTKRIKTFRKTKFLFVIRLLRLRVRRERFSSFWFGPLVGCLSSKQSVCVCVRQLSSASGLALTTNESFQAEGFAPCIRKPVKTAPQTTNQRALNAIFFLLLKRTSEMIFDTFRC